nr:hypothetical protein [Tanacetum cinerariifolium]
VVAQVGSSVQREAVEVAPILPLQALVARVAVADAHGQGAQLVRAKVYFVGAAQRQLVHIGAVAGDVARVYIRRKGEAVLVALAVDEGL